MTHVEKIENFIKNNNLTQFTVERNLLKYNNIFYTFQNSLVTTYEENKSFIINNLHYLLNVEDESDLIMLGFIEENQQHIPYKG